MTAEIDLCRDNDSQKEEKRQVCLAWIDVDRFKEVNDSFGHAAGDAVLLRIAERLTENIRRVDTLGRLGGEEFAVCMPGVGIKDAHALAERLRDAVGGAEIETAAGPLSIAISVGVAQLLPGDDAAQLLARADAAMYEAKRAGGNRVSAPVVPRERS